MAEQARQLPNPVDFDQLYPGRFLKAGDLLDKKPMLEISAVKIEELEGEKGKQVKGLVSFRGKDKQLVLNKTNGVCLKAMFGRRPQEWVGKRVSLFASTIKNSFTGEIEPCIRIWGSPDIAHDLEVEISLPRKKPYNMTMHRIAPAQQPTSA